MKFQNLSHGPSSAETRMAMIQCGGACQRCGSRGQPSKKAGLGTLAERVKGQEHRVNIKDTESTRDRQKL